jgi:hypothetical protein
LLGSNVNRTRLQRHAEGVANVLKKDLQHTLILSNAAEAVERQRLIAPHDAASPETGDPDCYAEQIANRDEG